MIDVDDIRVMREPFTTVLMEKIAEGDEEWLGKNYFYLTKEWFRQHFELEPNKTRLPRIDIPIYIFHGINDANVPVEVVYDLQSKFREHNKNNLNVYIFERHDHDLNFMERIKEKIWSEGYRKIFECAAAL